MCQHEWKHTKPAVVSQEIYAIYLVFSMFLDIYTKAQNVKFECLKKFLWNSELHLMWYQISHTGLPFMKSMVGESIVYLL